LLLEVLGHEVAAVVVAERQAAGGAGAEVAELAADRHADGLGGFETGSPLGHMPSCHPTSSAFQCSMTPNSQTLPSCTVAIWVASVAHIMLGARSAPPRKAGQAPHPSSAWIAF
jgi:hypothetical protein